MQDNLGSKIGLASDGASPVQFRVSVKPFYLQTWLMYLPRRYYGVIIPCIFNLIGMCGFCILNSILGGQTLAAAADGNLSWTYVSLIKLVAMAVFDWF